MLELGGCCRHYATPVRNCGRHKAGFKITNMCLALSLCLNGGAAILVDARRLCSASNDPLYHGVGPHRFVHTANSFHYPKCHSVTTMRCTCSSHARVCHQHRIQRIILSLYTAQFCSLDLAFTVNLTTNVTARGCGAMRGMTVCACCQHVWIAV